MSKQTPLHTLHQQAGAKLVDFAGWDMPLHYGSQLQEHHQVRRDAGMFDVSHMAVTDISGAEAQAYLRYLLANDVAKLQQPGKALYSCMLNQTGGVIDDLIVYFINENQYRIVSNAGTRDKDAAWVREQAKPFKVTITARDDLAIIAVQGPNACAKTNALFDTTQQKTLENLTPFMAAQIADYFVARTGYTGEEGYEIILPANMAADFWQKLIAQGVVPCGLGSRDTLRLEAGMNLYGNDMDENTTPLESNLTWTVAFTPEDRDFIGRTALEKQKQQGVKHKLVGLILQDKGVLRSHQKVVLNHDEQGETTSGTFSPTLNIAIAMARVPASIGEQCEVDIRGKLLMAKVVKPVFVRNGKSVLNNSIEEKLA